MIGMLLAGAGTAALLLIGEWLWQKKILKGEYARKFVHITSATFAVTWPLFVSRPGIALLSAVFAATLITIKKLKLFRFVHAVRRVTYGEIWYAVSIGLAALLFQDYVIYSVAVLHMALADGFAAVVGVSMKQKAKIFYFRKCRKSIAGSTTFIAISFALNTYYWLYASHYMFSGSGMFASPIIYSAASACFLALVEIASPKGSDNVLVPLFAGLLLWAPTVLLSCTFFS